MPEHLHTVAITGDEDRPHIAFTCHGDLNSKCHNYPACKCETWDEGHEHPPVQHDECWMKGFFDNADDGGVDPMPEYLEESNILIGASGPITAYFNGEYIEWDFVDA
jgi:hypothetical protein